VVTNFYKGLSIGYIMEKNNVFKIKERKETRKIFIGKCPVCNLKVKGIGREQVNWNLRLHMNQKHPDYFKQLNLEVLNK